MGEMEVDEMITRALAVQDGVLWLLLPCGGACEEPPRIKEAEMHRRHLKNSSRTRNQSFDPSPTLPLPNTVFCSAANRKYMLPVSDEIFEQVEMSAHEAAKMGPRSSSKLV